MTKTLVVSLSETLIRRHAADPEVRQLRDPRYGLLLRFHKSRARGTYHIRHYHQGRERWHKVGTWPDVPLKTLLAQLPDQRAKLALNADIDSVQVSGWVRVGEVLTWYRDRAGADRSLSESRRAGIVSAINAQLLPRVGLLPLADITRERIDAELIWPLQRDHQLSYVKSVYAVMRAAFRQASQLNLIPHNPLADLVFSLFIQQKIKPKQAGLKVQALPGALSRLPELPRRRRLLPLLILLHGTRISETRCHRWDWINWDAQELVIPGAHTKNGQDHRLPLTPLALELLRQHQAIERRYGASVWLFPGSKGRPIDHTTANDLFQALSARAWTSHDLRKLARTQWTDLGVDYVVGEQLLNHTLKDLAVVYIHTAMQEQKRAALEQYHAWLSTQLPPHLLSLEPGSVSAHTEAAERPLLQ